MSDASPLFCFLPYAFSFRCAKLSGTNCCGASQSAACPSDAGDERKYVHSRPPRSACCSLPPSADGARAGMQTDPTACRSDTAPSTHHHHHPSRAPQSPALTSITHKMLIVIRSHSTPTTAFATSPTRPVISRTFSSVMSHSTSDSCACASDSAQRRRYEAVCDTHPRQNSIVWMI